MGDTGIEALIIGIKFGLACITRIIRCTREMESQLMHEAVAECMIESSPSHKCIG